MPPSIHERILIKTEDRQCRGRAITITVPVHRLGRNQQPLIAASPTPLLCIVIRSPLLIAGFTFIYLFGAKDGPVGRKNPLAAIEQEVVVSSRLARPTGITITLAGNLAESNASSPPSPRRDSADYRWLYNGSQRGVCAYINSATNAPFTWRIQRGNRSRWPPVALRLLRSFLEGFPPMETCFRKIVSYFSYFSFLLSFF